MQKTEYYHPYSKNKYLHKGPNDIGMSSIPKSERCEGFRELWNRVFEQVMETWERVPVNNLSEFDDYENVENCDL